MDPVKLCCGKRQSKHNGVVCPDGLVMCALCFERVEPEKLYVDGDGVRWDVCKTCNDLDTLIIQRFK